MKQDLTPCPLGHGMFNPVAFHRPDGGGYELVGGVVGKLDRINPQVAARLAGVFNRWADYDETRRDAMKQQLQAIKATSGLSPDVEEIVTAVLKRDR